MKEKEVHATSELLKTANEKFDKAYTPINKSSVQVGKVMLKRSSTLHTEAVKKLDKIREQQKKVGTTIHRLLDEVLPSTSGSEKVSKGSGKKRKEKSGDEKGKGEKKIKQK